MAKKYSLDLVVVVILFSIYALCAILLCIIGAQIYHSTANSMAQNYDDRTSALYVMEKVRQNDQNDAINVSRVGESDALVFTEKVTGQDYRTWLFVQDGQLYEGTFAADDQADVQSCQLIMPMQSMEVMVNSTDRQVMNVKFTTENGTTEEFNLRVRASEGIGGEL